MNPWNNEFYYSKKELENEDEEDLEKRLIISDEQNLKSSKISYNSNICQFINRNYIWPIK